MKQPTALEDCARMIEIANLLRPFLRGGDLPFRLVRQHGGLRGLLRAPAELILAEPDAGPATVRALRSLERLARLFFEESLPVGASISGPADTEEFLVAKLRDLPHELFCCIYLDNRHRVIEFEELFRGTIDGTSVHPREVVKRALAVNAAAVIFAHNHPSGVAEPSQADERITRRLQAALEIVEIRLLDHLVIGDGTATSLARRGIV